MIDGYGSIRGAFILGAEYEARHISTELARNTSLDRFNNEAFDAWFDLVDDCRKTGDMTQVDAVLRACSLLPQVLTTDMLISVLRLVYNLRQHLPNWNSALISVRTELVRRGKENVDALLHGLES